jgi:hypothetical protein
MTNPHIAPVGHRPHSKYLKMLLELSIMQESLMLPFVPGPCPIRALAGPGTPGLALHSSHSDGYDFTSRIPRQSLHALLYLLHPCSRALRPTGQPLAVQNCSVFVPDAPLPTPSLGLSWQFCRSRAASRRSCPAPASRIPVQYAS